MTFEITKLIYRVPDFLTGEECQFFIDEYERKNQEHNYERCPDANTGEDIYSSFKRVLIQKDDPIFKLIHKKTEEGVNQYLKYLESFNSFHMPRLKKSFLYSHMYRLLKYDVGNKIHPHSDHDPFVYGSITFNLNDNYTGGKFKFFNGSYEVELKKGEMMIWPADYFWVHEVEPVETGVRYSTNSFLLAVPNHVRELISNNITVNKLIRSWNNNMNDGTGPYNII